MDHFGQHEKERAERMGEAKKRRGMLASVRIYTRVQAPGRPVRDEREDGTVRVRYIAGRPEDARWGLYFWMTVNGKGEPHLGPPVLQEGPHTGKDLARVTHHEEGRKYLHGKGPTDDRPLEPTPPLDRITGIRSLGAWTHDVVVFETPKPDRPPRERIILVNAPIASVVVWEVQPGRPELLDMFKHEDPLRAEILILDRTTPIYVIEVFTSIPVEPGATHAEVWILPSEEEGIRFIDPRDPSAPGRGLSSFSG